MTPYGRLALGLIVTLAGVNSVYAAQTPTTSYSYDNAGNLRGTTVTLSDVVVSPVTVTIVGPLRTPVVVNSGAGFEAIVMGTSDWALIWSIVEGRAGGTIAPTSPNPIDGNPFAVYTAPAVPGTYHVTATSVADPARFATVPVTVTFDYENDPAHCGSSDQTCAAPLNGRAVCNSGTCDIACNSGYAPAGSICINITNDPRNCGAVGHVCNSPLNGVSTCSNYTCGVTCNQGYTLSIISGWQCVPSAPACLATQAYGSVAMCQKNCNVHCEMYGDDVFGSCMDNVCCCN